MINKSALGSPLPKITLLSILSSFKTNWSFINMDKFFKRLIFDDSKTLFFDIFDDEPRNNSLP